LSLDEPAAAKFSIFMSRILASILTRRRAELRHGLRIAAAGMASFALAEALGLPQGYWAVFTAVLVVQGSVGGSWKAAVDRLLGTLLGAVYGAVIATLVPHENVWMLGTALAISLTPLALLAAFYPAYRVAPITAVILLLGSASVAEGPFLAGLLRTVEVSLGAFVGMAVSLFLLPARAHALMGNAANRVLQRLADLFAELVNGLTAPLDPTTILAKNDAVRAAQTALETIADEAARERRNYLAEDADPEPVPRTLRRVRHDLVLLGRVAAEPLPEDIRNHLQPCLAELSAAGEELLRAVGLAFAERKSPPQLAFFDAALTRVLGEIEAVRGNERLVALDFAFEELQRNLHDLTRRAQEFARSSVMTVAQAET
jgi:uncharacterized membrane protein YccC